MAEINSKEAFKMYLDQKKQVTENLTKLEQKELKRLEEEQILKRLMKRERYATDYEFRIKQQTSARTTMRKKKEQKNIAFAGLKKATKSEDIEEYEEEIQDPSENEIVDNEVKRYDPKRLY